MSTANANDTGPRSAVRAVVLAAAVLLVASAATAVFYGVSWAVAGNDESLSFATHRDDALRAGEQEIINFNTLDYRDVQGGMNRWLASSTGALHDEVVQGRDANAARIAQAKSTTTARVLDAAITELDDRAGKASMIAVVQVTVTPQGQPPTQKYSRYQANLTRDAQQQWKLSALGPVSVG
jgi:Mce-associated membrane protein